MPSLCGSRVASLALFGLTTWTFIGASQAATVTRGSSKDNTLYYNFAGAISNGAGTDLFAGINFHFEPRRALLEFDVESVIPAGSHINSVRLVLNMNRTIAGAVDMTLHRVTQEWGEGNSTPSGGGGGGGGAATAEEATWQH